MSTRLFVGLLGSIINPASLRRRRSRNMPRNITAQVKLQRSFLALAKQNRSRVPFYQTVQDEDNEETGEDVSRDDHWDYAEILWNGIQAKAVREAFEKLNYREQTLLEKRNAICMTCGRVSPISTRLTFEELAVLFEGSTASGAERAYRKAVDHLACLLTEAGVLHIIRLKRKSQTKRKNENRRRCLPVSGGQRRRMG
mgnify:CR=1 FL=1